MWIRTSLAIMSFATVTALTGCNRVSAPNTSSNAERISAMRQFDQVNQRNPMEAEACAQRAYAWLTQGKYDKALQNYDQAIRLDSENAAYWNSRGFTWHMKSIGERERPTCEDRALSDYARAIQLDANDASAINNRAWLWATSKVDRCRNGKRAVEEATKACELTGWKNAGYLDTLSVAYAEIGDFEQAIRWQRKALEDPAYQKEDGESAQEKLALYAKKQPFRE
jgi:tetratricopeptide (TPR) repeat protein